MNPKELKQLSKRVEDLAYFLCTDCRILTGTSGINEYYMVRAEVWEEATDRKGAYMLCIGCLEKRLGRKLTKKDFTDCPLNTGNCHDFPRSKRFKNRLRARRKCLFNDRINKPGVPRRKKGDIAFPWELSTE